MPAIYMSYQPQVDDTLWGRLDKIYLQLTSLGEDLYCKGAHLAEVNKQINDIQDRVRALRGELAELKREIRQLPEEEQVAKRA